MQFSIKAVLAIAISMSTLAFAAPAEPEAALAYRCCAFSDCTVCANNGSPVYSCDNCDQVGLKKSQHKHHREQSVLRN